MIVGTGMVALACLAMPLVPTFAMVKLFFAITGTLMALLIVGILFTGVATFRYLGGRTRDRELLTAHAIFWYAMAVVYSAIWFVVYVTK